MPVSELISYHDARMVEEAERADAANNDLVRQSHMDLSHLHFRRAGLLRSGRAVSHIIEPEVVGTDQQMRSQL